MLYKSKVPTCIRELRLIKKKKKLLLERYDYFTVAYRNMHFCLIYLDVEKEIFGAS